MPVKTINLVLFKLVVDLVDINSIFVLSCYLHVDQLLEEKEASNLYLLFVIVLRFFPCPLENVIFLNLKSFCYHRKFNESLRPVVLFWDMLSSLVLSICVFISYPVSLQHPI